MQTKNRKMLNINKTLTINTFKTTPVVSTNQNLKNNYAAIVDVPDK